MPKEFWKLIGNIAFYLVLVYIIAASFYMARTVVDVKEVNEQLEQEKEQLRIELIEMQIQRDEAIDAIWTENNRQMKEGD